MVSPRCNGEDRHGRCTLAERRVLFRVCVYRAEGIYIYMYTYILYDIQEEKIRPLRVDHL